MAAKTAVREKVTGGAILKGALAGLVGGLVGAGAKKMVEAIIPPRLPGEVSAPALLAERAVGHALDGEEQKLATEGIHWTFGVLAGAAYGAIAEMHPRATAWRGAMFGLTLNRITHEGLLPKAGLVPPVRLQSGQEKVSEWVSHAVYGVVTDTVRRGVRAGLD